MLFTNEENGLAGAKAYAEELYDRDKHIAGIEADIGGGAPEFYHKLPEGYLLEEESCSASLNDEFSIDSLGMEGFKPGYAGADINPLVQKGALGFGLRMDTSGYWPIHHTEADTLDKMILRV